MTTIALPIALGVIMLGLGLSLTPADFRRVGRYPVAVIVALACQLVVLPLVAFGLVLLFQLPPLLAVGMLLLAASPGGTTANLYSHLFRGDVALNISLTAINSVVAVFTLPIIVNLAFAYFQPGEGEVGLQFVKAVEVFAVVLVPVIIGMLIRAWKPDFALAADRPVRLASAVILVVVILGSIVSNWAILQEYFLGLAGITALFCVISLCVGFFVPKLFGVRRGEAIASAFEIGIHNATLAIVVAQSVRGQIDELALPAAVYGVLMFFVAAAFGFLIRGRAARLEEPVPQQ